jgi:mono/diheme cytochrome c family protein
MFRAIDLVNVPLITSNTAPAHGAQRTGGMGPALLPESLARLRRPEALKVIQEGRAATQMGGFAATLAPADIAALTEWIYQPVTPRPAGATTTSRLARRDRRLPKPAGKPPAGRPTR